MRRITSALFALAVLAAMATAGCGIPRTSKVTPSEGLLGGSEVAIELTGYPASTNYIIWQCAVGRELTDGCTVDPLANVTTDATGALSLTAFVKSSFVDQVRGGVDCTQPVACDITIYDPAANQNMAFMHTEFAGHDGLAVTPDRDLSDGQVVEVAGGIVGGGNKVMQCPTGIRDYTTCDESTAQFVDNPGGGGTTFTLEMPVLATIHDRTGKATDCTVPGSCMLISDINHGSSITSPSWHPLEFD